MRPATAAGAAAYTGCRIGGANCGGLKTVDMVGGKGRSPGVVLAQRMDYYRVVIGTGVCLDSVTNSRIEHREAIHAQGQVWFIIDRRHR